MGPFDELFDFNRDGRVDAGEFAMGMEMLDEWEKDEDDEDDEDDDW